MQAQDRTVAVVFVVTLLAVSAGIALAPLPQRHVGQSGSLRSFDSYDQMKAFVLQGASRGYGNYAALPGVYMMQTAAAGSSLSVPSFTTTNIQVEGVDEPDVVKTDGTYLYVASGRSVSIIAVSSPNKSAIVSTIKYAGQVQGLFILQGRLVVIADWQDMVESWNGSSYILFPSSQGVSFLLYDVSDVLEPALIQNVSVSGTYVNSRLTDGYVYAIVQQPTEVYADGNGAFATPSVVAGGVAEKVPSTDVFYSPDSTSSYGTYTIVLSMSAADGSHSEEAVMTGWGSTVYSSTSNIYLAFPDAAVYPMMGGVAMLPALGRPGFVGGSGWYGANTTIFRIAFNQGQTTVAAQGMIPGTILNQFSMDEYQGNLRVATTSYVTGLEQTQVQVNNVYVLDGGMKVIGALEGMAPKEKIYSVRFLGDVGYVVTFERIDPLFAISFADPTHPVVKSALELTGFSDYLHPMGGGYLLGVGKDTVPAPEEAGYVLYLGVKVSLFHVGSDGTSTEVARYVIGDRGSDTPVSTDHRAFTYDSVTGIVAFPITVAQVDKSAYQGGSQVYAYGSPVFQGAFFFKESSEGGLSLMGNVTQMTKGDTFDWNSNYLINRVVIIGGFAFSVSNAMVTVSSLADLSKVAAVQLPM